ncbi:hypothetical protein [Comamonas odontotermitis]|nr:hypothetical protein [Comamonas odontotermitis]
MRNQQPSNPGRRWPQYRRTQQNPALGIHGHRAPHQFLSIRNW